AWSSPWTATATPPPVRCRWRWTRRCARAACSAASCCCWRPSAAASPGARRCCATECMAAGAGAPAPWHIRRGTDKPGVSPVSSPHFRQLRTRVTQPTLAFVFPGQGSQSVGMLADLAQSHPVIRETFAEASEGAGVDLWSLAQQGPEEALNQTEYTQPALLAAGVAVWRAWQAQGGPQPAM